MRPPARRGAVVCNGLDHGARDSWTGGATAPGRVHRYTAAPPGLGKRTGSAAQSADVRQERPRRRMAREQRRDSRRNLVAAASSSARSDGELVALRPDTYRQTSRRHSGCRPRQTDKRTGCARCVALASLTQWRHCASITVPNVRRRRSLNGRVLLMRALDPAMISQLCKPFIFSLSAYEEGH